MKKIILEIILLIGVGLFTYNILSFSHGFDSPGLFQLLGSKDGQIYYYYKVDTIWSAVVGAILISVSLIGMNRKK